MALLNLLILHYIYKSTGKKKIKYIAPNTIIIYKVDSSNFLVNFCRHATLSIIFFHQFYLESKHQQ